MSARVLVEDAHGAAPNVPFWRGEAPARTAELSEEVAHLREKISALVPGAVPGFPPTTSPELVAAVAWLKEECGLDDAGAEQAVEYIVAGRAVLGAVPTQKTVIAERFFDEGGGMQLVIHAPFGGRINKAWGLALRKRFCRSFNFELQAAATDEGLNISLSEQHSFPLAEVFHFLHPESVDQVLEQAALASPIFNTRWRWDAGRALALLRFAKGKRVPLPIQRMRADDLLASVFPDVAACQENVVGDIRIPDHPLIREVMKDVLTEAMDLEGLKQVLRGIYDSSVRCLAVDTPVPSQFSHQILNANPYAYLDDAPLEERRARAVEMRRVLPEAVVSKVGGLDPVAVEQVREEAWPDVRDADELEEALQTLIALPADFKPLGRDPVSVTWGDYLNRLASERRATSALHNGRMFWISAARVRTFETLYPGAEIISEIAPVDSSQPDREEAVFSLVRGWLGYSGPVIARELSAIVQLPLDEIDQGLLKLEASGVVLRGEFSERGETEWCERRLLARIHRLTLGKLRREIEPVPAAQFMRWLLRWQHVAPGTQLIGERGTLEALRQLQGFEAPANAWEPQILARRIAGYDPKVLDQLCLTGAVGWGRLSPHPATLEAAQPPAASSGTILRGAQNNSPGNENVSEAGVMGREAKDLGSSGQNRNQPATRRVVPSSVAPVTFFVREDADWMTPQRGGDDQQQTRGLSAVARDVLHFLQQRGASFFMDIVRGTRRLKSEVETALWELVAAGTITADGFDNLRALIDPKRRAGEGRSRVMRPRHSAGRWSLLYSVEGADRARATEATCWLLLNRYGIVFRDLLARESILPKWRELLIALRRLEDQGEVRGGRFVSGFAGEQFALPVAVESLRATRRIEPSGETITVSAADPLNLVGIIVPGERVPSISGRSVTYRDGTAVISEEGRPVRLAAAAQ